MYKRNKNSKREKADVIIKGQLRSGEIKVDVDYDDKWLVKDRKSTWRSDEKSWYVKITELPEVRRSDRWYMKEGAREIYDELKIGTNTKAVRGAEFLGELDGKYLFEVQYSDKEKIKNIHGATWNPEEKYWTIPNNVDIKQELPKHGLQPLRSTSQILDITKERVVISHRGRLEKVAYTIREEEASRSFYRDRRVMYLSKENYNLSEIDKEKLKDMTRADELEIMTLEKLTSYRL